MLFFPFKVRVTVTLSCLLILATILGSTSRTLPETTQITFVEIWMMFVVLVTFAEIVLHTAIVYVKGLEKENANFVTKIRSVKSVISTKSSWSSEPEEAKPMLFSNKINHACGRIFFPSFFIVCTIAYVIIAFLAYDTQDDTNILISPNCKNKD